MLFKTCSLFLLSVCLFVSSADVFADYSQHEAAPAFVARMVKEHGFEKTYVEKILKDASKQQSILDAISRPAEKTLVWKQYKNIFLDEKRINLGAKFWQENKAVLAKASKEFGVPEEVIVAIIGVETRYGVQKGGYRVIDALTTLGFDYEPRASFFSKELEHFFLLTREQKQDPLLPVGSYAGAMGYGQFIPSSYRSYAIDYDGDDFADIWENPVDAIGSVANYFKKHGWQENGVVLGRTRIGSNYKQEILNDSSRPSLSVAELREMGFEPVNTDIDEKEKAVALMYEGVYGKEFWLGYNNFYVITRYNRSRLYAMAVWQLSRLIRYEYEAAA